MPRALEILRVVAPAQPGEGPVLVEVGPDIFSRDVKPTDLRFELPEDEVQGMDLAAGMLVGAMCHIFVRQIDEVRPQGVFVIPDPNQSKPVIKVKEEWS